MKPEHLGSLHTLRDVAEFLTGAGGTLAIRKTATVTVAGTPTATASTDGVLATLLDVIAEKTGYPVASLDDDHVPRFGPGG